MQQITRAQDWLTSDFKWYSLLNLDKADNLFMDARGNWIAIDAHNLISHLPKQHDYYRGGVSLSRLVIEVSSILKINQVISLSIHILH